MVRLSECRRDDAVLELNLHVAFWRVHGTTAGDEQPHHRSQPKANGNGRDPSPLICCSPRIKAALIEFGACLWCLPCIQRNTGHHSWHGSHSNTQHTANVAMVTAVRPDEYQREVPATHFPRLHFHITTRPERQHSDDVTMYSDCERPLDARPVLTVDRNRKGE
ncbi:hypothetical protein EYF80_041196 [Liparis tanakae]|uniref:Uncharacterized protein n=1 Tax=Liparis tanakae TaxID=230148 RepID=A0A4Z2G516_9TELE|nr:hypothetical protein EYF80_041196 [Liparis tanakae]